MIFACNLLTLIKMYEIRSFIPDNYISISLQIQQLLIMAEYPKVMNNKPSSKQIIQL